MVTVASLLVKGRQETAAEVRRAEREDRLREQERLLEDRLRQDERFQREHEEHLATPALLYARIQRTADEVMSAMTRTKSIASRRRPEMSELRAVGDQVNRLTDLLSQVDLVAHDLSVDVASADAAEAANRWMASAWNLRADDHDDTKAGLDGSEELSTHIRSLLRRVREDERLREDRLRQDERFQREHEEHLATPALLYARVLRAADQVMSAMTRTKSIASRRRPEFGEVRAVADQVKRLTDLLSQVNLVAHDLSVVAASARAAGAANRWMASAWCLHVDDRDDTKAGLDGPEELSSDVQSLLWRFREELGIGDQPEDSPPAGADSGNAPSWFGDAVNECAEAVEEVEEGGAEVATAKLGGLDLAVEAGVEDGGGPPSPWLTDDHRSGTGDLGASVDESGIDDSVPGP